MDSEHEIQRLNGEMFALRALLFYLLDQMALRDPALVKATFDNAADHAEQATINAGRSASPHHLAKALEIIEDFRTKLIPSGK